MALCGIGLAEPNALSTRTMPTIVPQQAAAISQIPKTGVAPRTDGNTIKYKSTQRPTSKTMATRTMIVRFRLAGLGSKTKNGTSQFNTIDTTTTGPHGPFVRVMK